MEITLLKAKIHRAVVTQADLNYVGSITIDSELMAAVGIMEYERVEIADVDNGKRFATYVIAGSPGSGVICVNGAAAHCVEVGDKLIIMAYANMTPTEAGVHRPKVVFVDDENHITRRANYERHGLLNEQE
ncbi:aspartate 1-decarboxylase [Prevotella sp. A2931]|uniref:Aspartate 1-decarboxylase n=1 Tax=Prevotella illustrans TaxID=2800387 RepID=A0ABS3M6V4_9BACT|nr:MULTISPECIES: aspartate 1-decarboxylase [Prevotella]MBO1363860.1 aspartate 1-decarboxylase [Prevotella illustrans]PTL26277.1 aspartate 1-decarboxylase [Prevotella sp. oral taxon 820]